MSQQGYRVRSHSDPSKFYRVVDTLEGLKCECPAFLYRGRCRHIERVHQYRKKLLDEQIAQQKRG